MPLRELLLVGVIAELCLCFKHEKELLRNAVGMNEVIGTQDLATRKQGGLGAGAAEASDARVCSMCGCLMFPEHDKAGGHEHHAQGLRDSSWTQDNSRLPSDHRCTSIYL